MSGAVSVKLSQAIKAHGDEIDEITLREPTTKDVIEMGLPTLIVLGDDGKTGIELRQAVLARYISRLAAIPMGSVEALTLKDHSACTAAVMGFFGQGAGETAES